jgi:hypothetical protein
MIIERSEDAAEFPSGEQGCQDVGVIFADHNGHDRPGAAWRHAFDGVPGGRHSEQAVEIAQFIPTPNHMTLVEILTCCRFYATTLLLFPYLSSLLDLISLCLSRSNK